MDQSTGATETDLVQGLDLASVGSMTSGTGYVGASPKSRLITAAQSPSTTWLKRANAERCPFSIQLGGTVSGWFRYNATVGTPAGPTMAGQYGVRKTSDNISGADTNLEWNLSPYDPSPSVATYTGAGVAARVPTSNWSTSGTDNFLTITAGELLPAGILPPDASGRACDHVVGSGWYGTNYYELIMVDDPYTTDNNYWANASTAAGNRVFRSVNGHLAVVTSAGENDFLYGLVPPPGHSVFEGAWLGGKASGYTPAAGGNWQVGPGAPVAFTYTNWGGGEPNNAGYAYMNMGTDDGIGIPVKTWADAVSPGVPTIHFPPSQPYGDPVTGYFVEYENPSTYTLPKSGHDNWIFAALRVRPDGSLMTLTMGLADGAIKHKSTNPLYPGGLSVRSHQASNLIYFEGEYAFPNFDYLFDEWGFNCCYLSDADVEWIFNSGSGRQVK
jgi:hypothetical protein